MSKLVAASPELKRLWIRVLKRVHPDLAVDEQDRCRCERLTQQANDAYTRRDEVALRAVLELNGPQPTRHVQPDAWDTNAEAQPSAPESTGEPPLVSQPPDAVISREQWAILYAAGGVLCLLLYGILDLLRQDVGRVASLSFLMLLAAAPLWWITRKSKLSPNHKARWVAAVAGGMILVGVCLLGSRPRESSLFPSARAATAHSLAAPLGWKENINLPPSQWYWDVIKSRVEQSWNPSSVVGTPAGATADIAFTISHDGSPQNVRLLRRSGSSSLDASCVVAVQQVRTFGPPEGGAKDSLDVLYPCSYNELAKNVQAPQSAIVQKPSAVVLPRREPAENPALPLGAYIQAAKNKAAQNFDASEVTGNIPAGATAYIQFVIWRHGNHDVPVTETSSGYESLDASCLRSVERVQSFGHLPSGYDNMTVLHHCTYPGPPASTGDSAVGDHNAPESANSTVVTN